MIKKIIEFIKDDVWHKKESDIKNPKVRWALRPIKIIVYTAKGFGEHGIMVRSAAMTFYTLMSIVPIAALVFGVMKGFDMDSSLIDYLYSKFPDYTYVIDELRGFALNTLSRTRGGIVAFGGVVVLFWAVIRLFGNIESAFNNIWEVKRQRSFARKFSDYIAVIFVAPILLIVSNSLVAYIRNTLTVYAGSWIVDILLGVASFIAIWLMFAFVYAVMPNTKVKFKGALMAGIVAGTVFQLFQWGYFYVQGQLNTYNAIYGTLAALPLFLVWLQVSWQILLFGAELSFAYQNVSKYEVEREAMHMSYNQRRKVLLATMAVITKHFLDNKGPVKSEDVADELSLPLRIVRDVIFDLERSGLVVSVKNDEDDRVNLYIPGRDVTRLTAYDVLDGVESASLAEFEVDETRVYLKVCKILEGIKADAYGSPQNSLLTDIIEDKKNIRE